MQTLVDAGRITEEEATVHPRRSLIMRALDGMNPVEADLSVREARDGDRYMLCTDGLSGVVSNDEIAAILADGDPTGAVTRLVDLALERGAPDNVTVVIADVVDVPDAGTGRPRRRRHCSRPWSSVLRASLASACGCPACASPTTPSPIPTVPRRRRRSTVARRPHRSRSSTPRSSCPPRRTRGAPPARRLRPASGAGADRRLWWTVGGVVVAALALLVDGRHRRVDVAVVPVVRRRQRQRRHGHRGGLPGRAGLARSGTPLSSLWSDSGLQVGTLPYFDQELVSKGIPAADEVDAQRIVSELQSRAAECQTLMPPSGCPGTAQ